MQPEVTRSRVHGEDVGGVLVVGFLVHLRPVVPEGRELQPRLGLVVRRRHLVRGRVRGTVRVWVRPLFGRGRAEQVRCQASHQILADLPRGELYLL